MLRSTAGSRLRRRAKQRNGLARACTLGLAALTALSALSAERMTAAAPPTRDPLAGAVIGKPRLDLSIPNPPSPVIFTATARRWAHTQEQRQACELAIDRWEQAERSSEAREFAELKKLAEEMSEIRREGSSSPRWQQGAEMLLEAVKRRTVMVDRRIDRERQLLLTLASLCELQTTDTQVTAMRAQLAAARAMQLSSPFAGAGADLGALALKRFAPSGEEHSAVEEIARAYWIAMEPLWEARYRSHCEELEDSARDAISRGGPGGAARPAIRRAATEATERVILANDSWIASFVVAAMPSSTCAERLKECRALRLITRERSMQEARPVLRHGDCDLDCCDDSPRARICAQSWQLEESVEHTSLVTEFMLMRERVMGPKAGAPLEFIAVWGAREELEQGIERSHSMALEAAGEGEQ